MSDSVYVFWRFPNCDRARVYRNAHWGKNGFVPFMVVADCPNEDAARAALRLMLMENTDAA